MCGGGKSLQFGRGWDPVLLVCGYSSDDFAHSKNESCLGMVGAPSYAGCLYRT